MSTNCGYRLVQLVNGTFSVHSLAYRETFHPVIGPVAEAKALYLDQMRIAERASCESGEFVIWDVGLGAAANVLTVLRALCGRPGPLRVISFDQTLEPLAFALQHADCLGYLQAARNTVERLLRDGSSGLDELNLTGVWQIQQGDFPSLLAIERKRREHLPTGWGAVSKQDCPSPGWPMPHAILFDAYSPARNPAMWTFSLFENLHALIGAAHPCNLATYSRSTLLRVTLLLAGFFVGAGHSTGEKEETTLAANHPSLIPNLLTRKWLQRVRRSTSAEPLYEPFYRQQPLCPETWDRLQQHPQFT